MSQSADNQRSERVLVEYAQENPQAFGELYDLYFPRIFRYVSWRVGAQDDIEDIVAEVFTKAFNKLHTFTWKQGATFSSWLFRIAHNAVVDHYRKNGVSPRVHIDDLPEIEADVALPDAEAERKELFQEMRLIVDALPERQKEIILMRFFGEMRNKEIAQVLGIGERSVASSLSRGLQTLEKALESSKQTR